MPSGLFLMLWRHVNVLKPSSSVFRFLPSLLVMAWLSALGERAAATGFEETASLADRGFLISARAHLLDSGEVLGSLAPHQQLSPASVSKLYTAGAVLERWGPQKQFTTRLVSQAEIEAGVLRGDLILDGGGAPGMTSRDYWLLVQGLANRGIRRIDGRVLASQWRFGPVDCVTTDRCQAQTRSRHAYDARLSSTAVDFASWCVQVAPGSAGASARVTGCAGPDPLVGVVNSVETVAGGETTISAERTLRGDEEVMVLSGTIAADAAPQSLYRSSADPAEQSLATLRSLLQNAGIAVTRGFSATATPPPDGARTLAEVEGKPMQALLLDMLNYSNNFMADVMALNLVEGEASMESAARALNDFAGTIPGHGQVDLRSGSGLTPESRVSAAGVVALLDEMYHRPALFPAFVAGMQGPVNGPMTFIRRGSERFQKGVMIKTGTLNEPVPVRSVAGYFRTESGRWGAFAVLVNGRAPAPPWLNWATTLGAVASDLDTMIADH